MSRKKNQDINKLIRPYTFFLQEGSSIKNNYMDYSLRLLFGHPQLIAGSSYPKKKKYPCRRR